MMKDQATQALPRAKKGALYYLKRDKYLYILLFLPMVHFILFKYVPMYGVIIGFKDYNIFTGIWESDWVGFANFEEAFMRREFWTALKNTFMLNGLDILMGFWVPIVLAIILNEVRGKRWKKNVQTIIYLPHFLSWVIIGGIVTQLLKPETGIVNAIIKNMGGQSVNFLTENTNWVLTYVLTGIWQNMGWGTILYLAAIAGINPELYEAAEIDGAGRFRRIWHVTLPGIRPTIVILLVLNIGNMTFIGFERPFIFQNQLVWDVGDVISTYVYREGLKAMNFSLATAMGLFQSLVGMVFLIGANWIARKNGDRGIW